MKPHQERVIEEKRELDSKLTKLSAFIGGETFKTLDADEQQRMHAQARAMQDYSEILGERIAAFTPSDAGSGSAQSGTTAGSSEGTPGTATDPNAATSPGASSGGEGAPSSQPAGSNVPHEGGNSGDGQK